MKNDTKQTLITLSLAGAIGYYLYNKLIKAGGGICASEDARILAARRTEEELSWRPTPVVEEPPVVEENFEQPVLETPVQEDLFVEQPVVAETVEEVVEQPVEEYVEPVVEENPNLFGDPVVETPVELVEPTTEYVPLEEFQLPTINLGEEQPVEPVAEEPVEEISEEVVEPVVEEVAATYEEPVAEELVVEEQPVAAGLICGACGFENVEGCKFCNNCGSRLVVEEPVVEEVVEPVIEPVVEEQPLITPPLDFGSLGIQLPNIEPVETIQPVIEQPVEEIPPIEEIQPVTLEIPVTEPVTEEPVEEDVSLDELENEEETSVEDLFGAVNGTLVEPAAPVQEEQKIMDNTEQLHKVDQKSESSRQEFKSILDFFAANGLT